MAMDARAIEAPLDGAVGWQDNSDLARPKKRALRVSSVLTIVEKRQVELCARKNCEQKKQPT